MLISRFALSAALPATTRDDSRYALDAINVLPTGEVVATDGHMLLIAKDRSPFPDAEFPLVPGAPFHGNPDRNVLLPVETAKRLIAVTPKKSTVPVLQSVQVSKNGSDQTFTVAATDLDAPTVATIRMEDAKNYPDHVRVLPKPDRAHVVPVLLGVDVLENLIRSAKAIGAKSVRLEIPYGAADRAKDPVYAEDGFTSVKNAQGEHVTKPGLVDSVIGVSVSGSDVEVTGCLMPMRR